MQCSVIYVNGNGNIRERKKIDSVNGNENGNEKITKDGNETETEKFETETDKFGYIRFRFRCISVSRHQRNTVRIRTLIRRRLVAPI